MNGIGSGRFWLPCLVALLFSVNGAAASDTLPVRFRFDPSSNITIEGSSTLHDWTCRGPTVKGYVEVGASFDRLRQFLNRLSQQADSGPIPPSLRLPVSQPPRVRVAVPIHEMDCGRKAMNQDMYEALKADKQPAILFELYTLDGARVIRDSGKQTYQLTLTGALALAARARTVGLQLEIQRVNDLQFHVVASKEMKMSDFDITPPSAFFGLIRAYNRIRLIFDLDISVSTASDQPVQIEGEPLETYGDEWLK